jgi:hypothetical protein
VALTPWPLAQAAARADPIPFWIFEAVVAMLTVIFLHRGLDAFWRLRTVADTPTARIRSAPQGYVQLCGRAAAQGGMPTAPLTRLPCVWYRFKVQERRRSSKNDRWVTIDRGKSELPFVAWMRGKPLPYRWRSCGRGQVVLKPSLIGRVGQIESPVDAVEAPIEPVEAKVVADELALQVGHFPVKVGDLGPYGTQTSDDFVDTLAHTFLAFPKRSEVFEYQIRGSSLMG